VCHPWTSLDDGRDVGGDRAMTTRAQTTTVARLGGNDE
jgi:hypothetical protein